MLVVVMSDVIDILYHDEAQLLDWGESRSAGKWIKLRLSETEGDPLASFRGLDTAKAKKTGHVFNLTIAQGDIAGLAINETSQVYGEYAKSLHQSGFFRVPAVWRVLGTDDNYQAWCHHQPCAICGKRDYDETYPDGCCEYMHVRRVANGAGRAIKPDYSGLPGCHACHTLQTNNGEVAAYNKAVRFHQNLSTTNQKDIAKAWFDRQRIKSLEKWAHERLVARLGAQSLTEIAPTKIANFCLDYNLQQYLPRESGG